ncbi:hypothetical protein LguiA_019320 [Lonicera macranthoides]
MDRRLIEAAWTGNIEYLYKLLEEDRCMLHSVELAGGETPLHIACMAGHLNFVREVLKLRRDFAEELNQDGFTPLHIAAAHRHIEIVKELLKMDRYLCNLEGREGRIPLHCAVIRGKIVVVKELLSASKDSIENTTVRGETALHLAVKNHQFQVFKALVAHLNEFNMEYVLNEKDGQGNTILHLAVIDLVLNEYTAAKGMMELNSLNKRSLTPLDILTLFQSEAGYREIEEIIRQEGGKMAEELHSSSLQVIVTQDQVDTTSNDTSNEESRTNHRRSPAEQLLEYFKYNNVMDSPSKICTTLLVIVILIATATYQAVLNPPGGVWQDDSDTSSGGTSGTNTTTPRKKGHTAGQAIMGTHNSVAYALFLVFNSIEFFTSVHMIYVLTSGFPTQLELQILLFALTSTYDTCMIAIIQSSILTALFIATCIVLPLTLPIITVTLRNHIKRPRDEFASTNQTTA